MFAASVVEDPDDLGYVPVHYERGGAITFFGVPTGRAVHVQVWEIDPRTWDWHEIQRRKIDTPSLDGWRESVVVR